MTLMVATSMRRRKQVEMQARCGEGGILHHQLLEMQAFESNLVMHPSAVGDSLGRRRSF